MTCATGLAHLEPYVDDELDAVRAREFEHHLDGCAECRAALAARRALRARLAEAPYFRAPERTVRRLAKTGGRRVAVPAWGWVAAAAAVVLVAIAGWSTLRLRSVEARIESEALVAGHVRSLLAEHLTDVASGDHHTVKPWFAGRLDFSPPAPDLGAHGFELAGGRLDYVLDHPTAAIVYRRARHVINVFAWPHAGAERGPELSASRGFNLVHWSEHGLELCAVSDLNGPELSRFAELFRSME